MTATIPSPKLIPSLPILLTMIAMPIANAQQVIYVDVNASASGSLNDGSSWNNAYTDLQDALEPAQSGTTIRVADGHYRPDRGTNSPLRSFFLKNGVSILGGYAGYGAPNPDARDIDHYTSTLTGLLSGSNSYHVVRSDANDNTAIIDGFTITGGHSPASDSANNSGGGLLILGGNPLLRDLRIQGNTAEYGGGIFCSNAAPTIQDCRFLDNEATASGGALYQFGNSGEPGLTITGCAFASNTARFRGGAIRNWASSPALDDCIFNSNSSTERGGAIANGGGSHPTIDNCAFAENRVISTQNETYGGAISNFDASDPTINSCVFLSNIAHGLQGTGGAIYNDASSPAIVNSLFHDNLSLAGGAMYNDMNSSPSIYRCIFFANQADSWGGAISNFSAGDLESPLQISSTLFAANEAENDGAAIFSDLSGLALVNCTFSRNKSQSRGGGLYDYVGCEVHIANCIFWGNIDTSGRTESAQIFNNPSNFIAINHTCVEGWTGTFGGVGNISDDPLFVNTNGTRPDSVDFRVQSDSPCINTAAPKGEFDPPLQLPQQDLDGHSRTLCSHVDIGAYEFGIADHNCDGIVDAFDFEAWPLCETGPVPSIYPPGCEAFDFEFNNTIDLIDFASLQEVLGN